MDKIIEQLVNIKSDTIEKMNVNKPTVLSEEEESEFRNATRCSNCKKLMNVMKKLEMPKHKIEEPKITNSSEVLSWGGCPKTTNNPRILSRSKPKAPIITLKKHPPQKNNNPGRLFGEQNKKQLLGGLGLEGGAQRLCHDYFCFLVYSLDCFCLLISNSILFFRVQQLRCPWQYWCCELISVDP